MCTRRCDCGTSSRLFTQSPPSPRLPCPYRRTGCANIDMVDSAVLECSKSRSDLENPTATLMRHYAEHSSIDVVRPSVLHSVTMGGTAFTLTGTAPFGEQAT